MESSTSQSERPSRRRALHFDADENGVSRPLVTRPGKSRGHLHRVDPYASIASGSASFQSGVRPSASPSAAPLSNNAPSPAVSFDLPGATKSRVLGYSESDIDDHSLAESSISSSSRSSSSLSTDSNINVNSNASIRSPELNTGTGISGSSRSNYNTRVTVSRSISWADAINVARSQTAEHDDDIAPQSVSLSTLPVPGHDAPVIGIGIGPMNHHHPLQKDVLPVALNGKNGQKLSLQKLVQQRGMSRAIQYTLRIQSKRIRSVMSNNKCLHKVSSFHRIVIFAMPLALIVYSGAGGMIAKHTAKKIDKVTKPRGFSWSPDRRLNNRQCVLNMFIDKQEPDEFNPDYEEVKPGAKNKDGTPKLFPSPPKLEPGSYRTKGQVDVISRFIASIADSYRPNLDTQQHLVFAGSRDGGHLAEEALKAWPPRGKYRTKLYVVADDETAPTVKPRDHSDRALQYGPVDSIEQRFQNHRMSSQIHIFDSTGEKAGLVNSYVDDDDVATSMEEEMFHVQDDDTFGSDVTAVDDDAVIEAKKRITEKRRAMEEDAGGNSESSGLDANYSPSSYFSLKKLLNPYLERSDDGPESLAISTETSVEKNKHLIPYLHVDGTSSDRQFSILHSARPFLLDGTISVVGVENSGDMDVRDIIGFFHSVRYKTFLLGKRQVMRIDHLCDETLDDLMNHPFITPKKPSLFRRALQKAGIVSKDYYIEMEHPHPDHHLVYPPFFVAFPRGRASFEEMTIQHMYDLFGGAGGGGQIATANDRKAPTKKKKSST